MGATSSSGRSAHPAYPAKMAVRTWRRERKGGARVFLHITNEGEGPLIAR